MSNGDFAGKRALVTGGASGIGLGTAQLLAAEGAKVAVLDVTAPPDGIDYAKADVTDDAAVRAAVAGVVDRFGGLDVLVNCAGIGAQGGVDANSDEEWHRVFDVNVVGMVRVARACLPALRASGSGVIVNVSSIAATAGLPKPGSLLGYKRRRLVAHAGDGGRPLTRGHTSGRGQPRYSRYTLGGPAPGCRSRPCGGARCPRSPPTSWPDGEYRRGGRGHRLPGLTWFGVDHRHLASSRRRNGQVTFAPQEQLKGRRDRDAQRPHMTGTGAAADAEQTAVRVDAHHHLWDLSVRDQPWTAALPALRRSFSMDDLRPQLATNHIDRTVLVQTVCVEDETPEFLAVAESAPEVGGVVGWADLCAPDIADRLAALRQCLGGKYLVGLRHQVQEEPDPEWLSRREVRKGLKAVGDAGLVYDFVVRHYQLPAVIETVAALGDVRFVLDHGGKPDIANGVLEPWARQIAELSRLPNIAVKLSGLVTEAEHKAWTRRPAPALRGGNRRRVRPGEDNVGLGLASVPAGGELWGRAGDSREFCEDDVNCRPGGGVWRHGAGVVRNRASSARTRPFRRRSR